jgi:dipeptidyl aminopeptidase/acylaminoacyl peptidase
MTALPPDQLLSLARAHRPTPAADGSLTFASDLAGLVQTHRLAGPDRFPVRLAPSQERTLPLAGTPLGLLVRTDRGGNETWQLGLIDGEGLLRTVTRDARAIHRSVHLAPDRRRAGIAFNPGGRADWAVGVIDLESGEIETWVDRGGYWDWLAWSEDGSMAVVAEASHTLRNRAYLLDADSRELRPLLPTAELVAGVSWAGGRLFCVSDLDRDFPCLVEVDPSRPDHVLRRLVDEEHEVVGAVPDPTGRRIAVIVNDGIYDSLRILDLDTGDERWHGSLPPGLVFHDNTSAAADHVAWSADGGRLFVAWESATSPAEILELPAGTRWTRAAGDPPRGLVEPVEVRYRSFDGLEIPALHYRVDGRPRPTVVMFHGGPESQSRGRFQPELQIWIGAGFDVLAPNVRGSTGYGRRFSSLDDRERRWDSVRDGCEAGRWLRREGMATRLVAMGGSYGGFMTLAVLVEDPDLWDAGVEIFGIADWESFFRNTSGWRRAIRASEYGDPEHDPFLAEFSPLRRASAIRAPLLIIHGHNDVRVPFSEAEQIHRAVPDSELLAFDDEGHGFTRHRNRVRAFTRAVEFCRERLS